MKRLLLDTHALLWWLSGDSKLGRIAKAEISNPKNEVYVSAASIWEIAIKKGIGKLTAPADFDAIVDNEGFLKLPISLYHGEQAGTLPQHHKDPFDRMLVAQAQAEGLTLVTSDKWIDLYQTKTLGAGS